MGGNLTVNAKENYAMGVEDSTKGVPTGHYEQYCILYIIIRYLARMRAREEFDRMGGDLDPQKRREMVTPQRGDTGTTQGPRRQAAGVIKPPRSDSLPY
ncbi:hypothetical protein GGTG_03417 [Gaeumannomyces tritici R3-111a-1]|uniref:Uncharacterized protein n=1 Tax=Gaeumannomyces tritici (strain R3-111a-1) TaxID=644352 RepID=J3NQ60_GAET3|nr:hypothetical protein GGTG_03417 [Gaeumannomyces tritici R3-111a-1]EJT78316.1 hypothetical protein GGTG_03417 [Gaeumannomyces tritici R3-111a-1]